MTMNDGRYLYQDFNAIVAPTYTVKMGTAVEFVPRTEVLPEDWNPIPLIRPAAPDNNVAENDPRTTYVGVAMNAANAGGSVTVRYWGAGTTPALVFDPHGHDAGAHLYWDGHAFIHDIQVDFPFTTTSVEFGIDDTISLVLDSAGWTPHAYAGKAVKIGSGYHQDEFYSIYDNTDVAIFITVVNTFDHWTPSAGGDNIIDVDVYEDTVEDLDRSTAVTMTSIPANNSAAIYEILVLKGGRV